MNDVNGKKINKASVNCDEEKQYILNVREDALRILDYGDNTQAELKRKLSVKGHDSAAIDEVVSNLTEQHYVDDRRFAENYARVKSESGKGPLWIRGKLTEKGVSSQLISEVLSVYSDIDSERMACLEKALKICGLDREFDIDEYGSVSPANGSDYEFERAGFFEPDDDETDGSRFEVYKYREKKKARLIRKLTSAGFSPSAVYYSVNIIADL